MTTNFETLITERIELFDPAPLAAAFVAQDEFVKIDNFLPASVLRALLSALPNLDHSVHRNYIPRHKKGGSVSRYDIDRRAPCITELYNSPSLKSFLRAVGGVELDYCPANDPHTYALYYYTEPGDHIGYHYDTSYYKGARYTVLLGLASATSSCRLEYQLHTKTPDRAVEQHSVVLEPGMLVMFNGDKLYHRITPLADNERRISLTLEYITDPTMHPLLRFVSNMKDSIAYFGFKQVFKRTSRQRPG